MKPTFSDLISELTETWLLWMKHHNKSVDESLSYKERRQNAEECERLINIEHQIVKELDDFFE